MNKEIELSAEARTNPIFLTAKTAACLMADAGIPDADSIVSRLDIQSADLGMSDPDMMLGNELVVEAKYRTMCRLIEETGIRTNVDLPCGYTPKAIHMSDKAMGPVLFVSVPCLFRNKKTVPVFIFPAAKAPDPFHHGYVCFLVKP